MFQADALRWLKAGMELTDRKSADEHIALFFGLTLNYFVSYFSLLIWLLIIYNIIIIIYNYYLIDYYYTWYFFYQGFESIWGSIHLWWRASFEQCMFHKLAELASWSLKHFMYQLSVPLRDVTCVPPYHCTSVPVYPKLLHQCTSVPYQLLLAKS